MMFIICATKVTFSERDKAAIIARHAAMGNPSPFTPVKPQHPEPEPERPATPPAAPEAVPAHQPSPPRAFNLEEVLAQAQAARNAAADLRRRGEQVEAQARLHQSPDRLVHKKKNFIEKLQHFLALKPVRELEELINPENGMAALERHFEDWARYYRQACVYIHPDKLTKESDKIKEAGTACFQALTDLTEALEQQRQ